MKSVPKNKSKYVVAALALVVASAFQTVINSQAHAATLTNAFVRFDRMMISTPTTGTVCANPTTTGTETTVAVTFPAGYTVSTTAGNWTTSTTNLAWPTGGTAWAVSSPSVSAQTVTWTSPDLTVGTLYCFNWTNSAAISTPSGAANNLSGTIATNLDTASFATAALSNDQIVVSATIPQSFSFALSGNTDSLSLVTGSVATSATARTATVNTNAKAGWTVWAKDLNTGLLSATASKTIASTTPGTNSTLIAGTEGYNLGVTSAQGGGSGTITVQPPFVGGSTGKGGGLDTTLRPLAISNGSANNAVLTLTNNGAISTITPAAADYSDTEYVTAAGLF